MNGPILYQMDVWSVSKSLYVEFKRKGVLASKDLLHFEQNDEFVKANDLKIASSLLEVIIEWAKAALVVTNQKFPKKIKLGYVFTKV